MQLGQSLLARGGLQLHELERALDFQNKTQPHPLLGSVLLSLHMIDEALLAEALAAEMNVEVWDLKAHPPDPELKNMIPAELALRCRVIPHASENGYLRCAAAGPVDASDRAKIEFHAERAVRFVVAPESAIADQLQALYGLSVENVIEGLARGSEEEGEDQELFIHDLREMAQEPTLINLVNVIISNAVGERASDIHIEPFEAELKIKYRIDGILQEMPPPPKKFQSAIVSRVKIMAGMDIAERYVPQDGQIRVNLATAQVDIRVATMPTVYGECVVLRLLNKDEELLKLGRLGMDDATHARFNTLLGRPYGIILVCGPTGSGKTTTLYGALIQIYTPEKKIITIEDPVEYQIQGINQIPVRPKRGLSFASGLRAIVRQDPDIIMVGEVRDRETADIAIRAALTGHLVFSTLHTNDAPGAVTRLLDMGVEPFLIASSTQGILAQRLVRRICRDCARSVVPNPMLAEEFGVARLPERILEPAGCELCRGRGYLGRVGIFELMIMSQGLHDMVLRSATSTEIREAASKEMQTMRGDGWNKIVSGTTSVSEVLQVTQFDSVETD